MWIAGAALATWTVPVGSPASGARVMPGAVALVVQATLAARHMAPNADALPLRLESGRMPGAFKLLVHGLRSDVALARAVLATPDANS